MNDLSVHVTVPLIVLGLNWWFYIRFVFYRTLIILNLLFLFFWILLRINFEWFNKRLNFTFVTYYWYLIWIAQFLRLFLIFNFLFYSFFDFLLICPINWSILILFFFKLYLIILVWWSNFNLQIESSFLLLVRLEYLIRWRRILIMIHKLIWFIDGFYINEVSIGLIDIFELFLLWRWKIIAHLNCRWSGWRPFRTYCVLFWVVASLSHFFNFFLILLHSYHIYFINKLYVYKIIKILNYKFLLY